MNKLLLILCVLYTALASAQQSTNSPYSIYGLGQEEIQGTTAMMSMGGVGTAVVNPIWINSANPASYTDISRPSFNFDVRDEYYSLSSGNVSQSANSFSIQNFSFAFPIINNYKKFKRRCGFSFGLTPYTSSGYDMFFTSENADLGNINYHFFGDGSINRLNAGLGFDLLANKKRTNVLSLGINGQYVFGNIARNRATEFSSASAASSLYRSSTIEISDIGYNAGIRFSHIDTIKTKTALTDSTFVKVETPIMISTGASITPALILNTNAQQLEYTYTDSIQNPNIIDTLIDSRANGQTNAPLSISAGLSFNINNAWTIAVDARHTMWSNLTINDQNAGLNDATRLSAGIEWVPEYDKRGRGQYARIIRYRIGGSFEQTMLNLSGVQPIRYGINFGLGLPLGAASASTSMFNIGGEVAQRQTSGSGLNETFFNLHVGFVITPHRYDQWFAKRKYD